MAYFIPSPAGRDTPSRSDRILQEVPQAASALDRIKDGVQDLPFGSALSTILNDYHFPPRKAVEEFFRVYLTQGDNKPLDEAQLKTAVINTINCLPGDLEKDSFTNDRAFERIFNDLNQQIIDNEDDNVPLVNFIVGPTGAGKTAFSKALFSVCRHHFWRKKIVPSRVEFSKFASSESIASETFAHDPEFHRHVRRCQLRDLLIYFCSSGYIDADEKMRALASLKLLSNAEVLLKRLVTETQGFIIDGEHQLLDKPLRAIFNDAVRDLGNDRDKVLYQLASQLEVRFLVSCDGFDSTHIEHFLFDRNRNVPIELLTQMVKGLHEKVIYPEMEDCPLESHYLVYLRDTTFAGLRTNLFRKVGGIAHFPVYWIVPPAYSQLVQNVAVSMTGNTDSNVNLATDLSNDIFRAFDRSVFDVMDLKASSHLAFVFGSSGRRMKTHIRHLLVSALHRVCQRQEADLLREKSGIDAANVWADLVGHHRVEKLHSYIILEDLFLNDSHQLVPKLELDPGVVTDLLEQNDFKSLVDQIVDLDETSGTFGCLFNYFYRMTVSHANASQPAILILVRILQFIKLNPHCNADEVASFMRDMGYDAPDQVIQFCLFVLLRCELAKWDSSSGRRSVRDVPLFISTTGRIALSKLMFSTTYVSEAMLSSIQLDRSLTRGLRHRVPEPKVWIADCISNASIALHVIFEVEKIERVFADKNMIDYDKYSLYGAMERRLSKEASVILQNPHIMTSKRWAENEMSLLELQVDFPSLKILGSKP